MTENLEEYAEMVPMLMTIVSVTIVLVEWIVLSVLRKVENHKEGWVNVGSAALSFLPVFLLNFLVTTSLMFFVYQFRLFDLGLEWYVWVLAYAGYDFMSYVIHYLSHKVRILWAVHSAHHSAKEMKASVSFRGSFADFVVSPHLILWLPILGFHPLMLIIVEGIALLYGVPLHLSEHLAPKARRGWIRKLIITPSAHRLHHANNFMYLDTNYGLTFAIWDNLFRTYQHRVESEQPIYGLRKEIDSDSLVETQLDEWKSLWRDIRNAPRWSDKIKYMLMPPGWDHSGEGKTVAQMRREALASWSEPEFESQLRQPEI